MQQHFDTSHDFARELDNKDPLRHCRELFHLPRSADGKELIYFCGNSLGLQPKTTPPAVQKVLTEWQTLAVEGWFEESSNWLRAHELVNARLAKIVGAKTSEVCAMNALTVNLHLLMASFYRPDSSRHKIIIEGHAFPSDQYAVKSQIAFHGFDPEDCLVEVLPSSGSELIQTADIEETLKKHGRETALVLLSGMNYYTGQAFDMKYITELAHSYGATVGFDLAHAAGNLPLALHDWNVDFAAWCTYKYLNSGPGGLGAAFVHERHHGSKLPRLEGWWGNNLKTRFLMGPDYDAGPGAEAWCLSTSPMLLLASLGASLEIFETVGMSALREKSLQLTAYLEFLIGQFSKQKYSLITPAAPEQRGCQLSLSAHKRGKELFEKIIAAGVICDWREPNVIRLAPVPLYNSFEEVYQVAKSLAEL